MITLQLKKSITTLTEKSQTSQVTSFQQHVKKSCRKLSIRSTRYSLCPLQMNQEKKESLQMILLSSEYLSWTNTELFKPIHDVLKNPFIKINYFRSDVLFKLMNILKYLEEKNFTLKEKNITIIKITKLQNFLLKLVKCLGFTMNIIIPVEQFPLLENDFDNVFDSTWKRIWKVSNGINMNLYKDSFKHGEVFEKIDKWING